MRRRSSKKHPDIDGDNGLGRSRGGLGTKIHLATDGSGLPLNIVLSPGQSHEASSRNDFWTALAFSVRTVA